VLFVSVNPGGVTGGSGTLYFIGDWNGKEFIADDLNTRWLDYGRDNYAGVTFNDVPNNKRIYLGWMNNWEYADKIPANPYRGSMTIPRELNLVTRNSKLTLLQKPVVENSSTEIVDHTFTITSPTEKTGMRFSRSDGRSVDVGYDPDVRIFYIDRTAMWFDFSSPRIESAPCAPHDSTIIVRVIIDSSSIEVFINDGEIAITDLLIPGEVADEVSPI
jgi:levanase/fructan beta-fructosidase